MKVFQRGVRARDRKCPRRHSASDLSIVGGAAMRRRLVSLSPFLATLVLTGAIFLLPPTSDGRQASAGEIQLSTTHIGSEDVEAP